MYCTTPVLLLPCSVYLLVSQLQHEVRFLVAGTHKKIFLLPCKYTAIRCTHMGMEQQKFTYDPEKPGHQFLTYLKAANRYRDYNYSPFTLLKLNINSKVLYI